MNRVLGIALVVFALGLAIVPHYTDCFSQGNLVTLANGNQQPMKCHWTAQGEIAIGAPLAAVGAIMTFSRRKQSMRILGVMGIALGALAFALPTSLIGTCGMATHICNTAMKPAIFAFGGLVLAGSVGAVVTSFRTKLE